MPRKETRKRKPAGLEGLEDLEETIKTNWLYNFTIKKPFNLNDNHRNFYNCIKDDATKMVFVDGPAGSGKSYYAVLAGLEMIKEKKIKGITYIRSVVESASKSIGALPGEIDDKFHPYAMPLIEKAQEITDKSTCASLLANNIIHAIPVNFVRGLTFTDSLVIVDEIQNISKSEATSILTRFGKNTKYVICGDSKQSDISNSCWPSLMHTFSGDDSIAQNIYNFKFSEDDIVRSKILKFIVRKLEAM